MGEDNGSGQQRTGRKRESTSADQFPSPKRRCTSSSTDIDATIARSASHGMKSHQVPNVVSNVKTIGLHLPAAEIVGAQFDEYIKDVWSWVMDADDVFRIGIHGTGGVGKTEVAKHINNKLLWNQNKFHHVFWVDVPPDWKATMSRRSIVRNLQSSISKVVDVHLSDEDDETERATQLSKGLAEKKKHVLILDNVWGYIPLREVGIPIGANLCTVVLTTRSLETCEDLGCQKNIEIICLPPDESYELFKKNLGMETPFSIEVEKISRSVADKCAGLPLAITIMSRYMKGVNDIHLWRKALEGHTLEKADMEIFQKLKVSYDYLKDTTLQKCFLYCPSLCREHRKRFSDFSVQKRRLVEYLVDEGIVMRRNSRREELVEAHTKLNFLHHVGLLEIDCLNVVKMNALIRNMALQIMEENQQGTLMIKNDMSLKEVPDEESWTEDLVRVSLEGNEIKNILLDFSPSCSNLSTLLLSRNCDLGDIGETFFAGMPGLKVLDLSKTGIVILPSSIYNLVNLTTLILSWCRKLRVFPSLEKLRALKKLDLNFSAVEGVAKDIDKLLKLTYLDLFFTRVTFEPGVLARLSCLQFLRLPQSLADKGDELACLSRLESLTCSFPDAVQLNKYLLHLKGGFKGREPPLQIDATVGSECLKGFNNDLFYNHDDLRGEEEEHLSVLALKDCNINEADKLIYFEQIAIVDCHEPKSLCSFTPIQGATELKYISIRDCDGLEFLCSLSLPGQGILENLEYMELFNLENLSVLFLKEGNINAAHGSCFSNLTRFVVQGCPSIKRLFPMHLLQNLKNLERLHVIDCFSLEEIFAAEEGEESSMDEPEKKIDCYLPNLSIIRLVDLPELKGFCGEGITWSISKSCAIGIKNCPNLITCSEWSRYGGLSDDY